MGTAGVVKLVLLAAIAAVVTWRVDWLASYRGLDPWAIVPLTAALAAFTLSAALKAVIWAQVLRGLRPGSAVRGRELVSPVFIGLLGNWIAPARLGEAARVVLGHRRLQRRGVDLGIPAVTGGAAVEMLVSSAAWAVVGLAAAILLPVPGYVASVAIGAGAVIAILLVLSIRGGPFSGPATPAPSSRWGRLLRATRESLRSAAAGVCGLARPRSFAMASGTGLLMVLLQWLATFLVLEAMGIDVGWEGAAAILITTTVVQSLPLLPGGIGSFQAAAALPLVASYGVAGADAVAVAVLLHAAQAATAIVPGLVFLAREDLTIRSLRGRQPVQEAA